MVLSPIPLPVQQMASRTTIQHSETSHGGASEWVERDVVVRTGSRLSSCGTMRDCGLNALPLGEAPRVPCPDITSVNVCGLLERKHEAVDQGGGYANVMASATCASRPEPKGKLHCMNAIKSHELARLHVS
jgi:hypothetical protein